MGQASVEIELGNLELVARALGERWAKRRGAEYRTDVHRAMAWPCTLEEARRLVDETFGAKLSYERREPLAVIVDRNARTTWRKLIG